MQYTSNELNPRDRAALIHYKYIYKKKVNGKWRYYYDRSGASVLTGGKKVVAIPSNKNEWKKEFTDAFVTESRSVLSPITGKMISHKTYKVSAAQALVDNVIAKVKNKTIKQIRKERDKKYKDKYNKRLSKKNDR